MALQKCPVCDGTGHVLLSDNFGISKKTCPQCEGKRIIDSVTGLPPKSVSESADGKVKLND
jgi:RecJ-like exonuclease